MVTRRTTQRQFLLRPSKAINGCIKYCVALAAEKSGVRLHALVFMSNHYHIVLTDVLGKLPLFTTELNRLLAKSLNVYHDRGENFWAGHVQPSHVLLPERADIYNKLLYLLNNPVEAGLVSKGKDWPGVRLYVPGKVHCKRPKFYFRSEEEGGRMPKKLSFELSLPEVLGSKKEVLRELEAEVKASEVAIGNKRKSKGLGFLGAKVVKQQAVTSTPISKEWSSSISPRLACADKWRRAELLQLFKDFQVAYKDAWEQLKSGFKNVEFPLGTYRLARYSGVTIDVPDTSTA